MTAIERYQPMPFDAMLAQAEVLARSALVPKAYRGKPSDIVVAHLLGQEIGLGPMATMSYVDVIEGNPTLNAEGKVALVRRAGHSISGEINANHALVEGKRHDSGDHMTVEFTMDMARRAGLAGKAVWKQYPEAMLWSRAVSQLCRMLFPDVLMGLSYTGEEVEAFSPNGAHTIEVDEETGEVLTPPPMAALAPAPRSTMVRPPPGQDPPRERPASPDPVGEAGSGAPADAVCPKCRQPFGDAPTRELGGLTLHVQCPAPPAAVTPGRPGSAEQADGGATSPASPPSAPSAGAVVSAAPPAPAASTDDTREEASQEPPAASTMTSEDAAQGGPAPSSRTRKAKADKSPGEIFHAYAGAVLTDYGATNKANTALQQCFILAASNGRTWHAGELSEAELSSATQRVRDVAEGRMTCWAADDGSEATLGGPGHEIVFVREGDHMIVAMDDERELA